MGRDAIDTSPDARRVQEEAHRRLGPEGRLRTALEMSESLRRIRLAGLRAEYPEDSEAERIGRYVREVHGIEPEWL